MKNPLHLASLSFFVLVSVLPAKLIRVPSDQPTIQSGMDASNEGDTVLVNEGTYVENIDFYGKNIIVTSKILTTADRSLIARTIIDGGEEGRTVTFSGGEDSTALLAGFTIIGHGIYCNVANPRLRHLYLTRNRAEKGSAISCYESSPDIFDVVIADNNGRWSTAIYLHSFSSPTLENVLIAKNSTYFNTGWIYCQDYSSPTFINVTISGNWGAARKNKRHATRKGMQGVDQSRLEGIYISNGSHPVFINSIIWNKSAQEVFFREYGKPSSITLSYCNLKGGTGSIKDKYGAGEVKWMEGNITADPRFKDPSDNNFGLAPVSPCRDAGSPEKRYNDADGTRNDMGYYGGPVGIGISPLSKKE